MTTKSTKFSLGQVTMTRNIAHFTWESQQRHQWVNTCLLRHQNGDWGDLSDEDVASNEEALKSSERLFSVYRIPDELEYPHHQKVWIITERDRSVTTVLFPSDY